MPLVPVAVGTMRGHTDRMSLARTLNALWNPTNANAKAKFSTTGAGGARTKSPTVAKTAAAASFFPKGVSVVRTLKQVEDLVRRRQFKEAESVLTSLLRKDLRVRWSVFDPERAVTITTPWLTALHGWAADAFERFVKSLVDVLGLIQGAMSQPDTVREVIAQLKSLQDTAQEVDLFASGHADGIKHGPYLIVLGAVDVSHLEEIFETVDYATKLTRRRFPEVCYGKIYFREDIRGPEKGSYNNVEDTIVLSLYQTAERNSVRTLIHEFGHRYDARFLTHEQRVKFQELSYTGEVRIEAFSLAERERMADRYLALQDYHRQYIHDLTNESVDADDFMDERMKLWFQNVPKETVREFVVPWLKRFRDQNDTSAEVVRKLRAGLGMLNMPGNYKLQIGIDSVRPLYASDYGRDSCREDREDGWKENFADSFLKYVIGEKLPPPLKAFMGQLR